MNNLCIVETYSTEAAADVPSYVTFLSVRCEGEIL